MSRGWWGWTGHETRREAAVSVAGVEVEKNYAGEVLGRQKGGDE